MKKWLCVLLFSASAYGNTYLSSLSDLWWNENESGWGVTIVHQREVIFLTFFVYGADGRARWYTGQANYVSSNAQGAYIFSGQTIEATGPWLGTFFNPSLVSARLVGTVTLTSFLNSATLTYTIDGVTVTKNITRQTFRSNDLSGTYAGVLRQTQTGCAFPNPNGTFNDAGNISISHSNSFFSMTVSSTSDFCTYSGTHSQEGTIGRVDNGTYACNSGLRGTFRLIEIVANINGINGRFTAANNVCTTVSGRFGAVRN